MIEYIYLVKCPDRTEEPFDFFDEAKDFAIGCLSNNPIITQIEVDRNDFGECTDSRDLGTVWSWEDMMQDITTDDEPAVCVFTKDDLKQYTDDNDPEFQEDDFFAINSDEESMDPLDELFDANFSLGFDGGDNNNVRVLSSYNPKEADEADEADELELDELFDANISLGISGGSGNNVSVLSPPGLGGLGENCSRKPIPDGMTIKELVEEMEENEDTVECTWCEDLFDKSECRYEINLGWLCSHCQAAIMSRGETLTFRENSYWDFLDEEVSTDDLTIDDVDPTIKKIVATHKMCRIDFEQQIDERNRQAAKTGRCPVCGGTLTDMVCDHCHNSYRQNGNHGSNLRLVDAALVKSIEKLDPSFKGLSLDRKVEYIYNSYFGDPNEKGTDTENRVDQENNRRRILGNSTHDTSAERVRAVKQQIKQELLLIDKRKTELDDALSKIKPEEYLNHKVVVKESMLEELEDADTYRERLTLCPECGGATTFDDETGMCINCGFNTLTEDVVSDKIEAACKEKVDLDYSNIEVTGMSAKRDVDDWDEWTELRDFVYTVDKQDIIETLFDYVQEEDVASIGGLKAFEALSDDDAWLYMIDHFDELFEKYEQQLLKYYEDRAAEAAQEDYYERSAWE